MEGRSYGDDANDEDESNERTYYTSDLVICEINRPELLRSRHKREDKQARIRVARWATSSAKGELENIVMRLKWYGEQSSEIYTTT